MTKAVRIENADTSAYRVVVTIQDKVYAKQEDGQYVWTGEWKDAGEQELNFPTAMSNGLYLTFDRRLVVTEA